MSHAPRNPDAVVALESPQVRSCPSGFFFGVVSVITTRMTKPSKKLQDLQRWIVESASVCALAQGFLDAATATRSLNAGSDAREVRKQLAEVGLELPLTRQVIQRMEMKLHGRWVKSQTIGFRVEAGARWGKHFAGLSYEQETTTRERVEAAVTIHVEAVPFPKPRSSTPEPTTPQDLQQNPTQTVP